MSRPKAARSALPAGSVITPHDAKVLRYLQEQGYSTEEANSAIARALTSETGSWPLRDHYVYFDGAQYAAGPIEVATAADIAAAESRSLDAAIGRAVKGKPSRGHVLARRQIARHGRDRYPAVPSAWRKLGEEMGELGEALISYAHAGTPEHRARIEAEYGDVGLSLHNLGDKLGLDLIRAMTAVVENDTRDFRENGARP